MRQAWQMPAGAPAFILLMLSWRRTSQMPLAFASPSNLFSLGICRLFPRRSQASTLQKLFGWQPRGIVARRYWKLSAHLCGRLRWKHVSNWKRHRGLTAWKNPFMMLNRQVWLNCLVSREYHFGSMLLEPDMPLVWPTGAGVAQFFVEYNLQHYMIFEKLQEVDAPVRFSRKFVRTGMKEAMHLQPVRLELPTWWLFEGSAVLMLLWKKIAANDADIPINELSKTGVHCVLSAWSPKTKSIWRFSDTHCADVSHWNPCRKKQ